MSAEAFGRAFVACYFLFVALHYTARLSGLRARKGYPHAPIGRVTSRNGLHQILFRVFRAAILTAMTVRVFDPAFDRLLLPIPALEATPVLLTGIGAMGVGLFVIDYVHSYLNDEWRSGTGGPQRGPLVTAGPYAISRNPLFAGVLLAQAGTFLAAPSVFTLVCLVVGAMVIRRQVAVEEADLGTRHGETFAAYRARVPRWGFAGSGADAPQATR